MKETGREVVQLIFQELRRMKDSPVEEKELRLAQDHLKGSLMLSLESSSSRMSNLARQEVYFERQFTLNEVLERVEQVTREEMLELARDLFDSSHCTLAVLGKTDGLQLDAIDLAF